LGASLLPISGTHAALRAWPTIEDNRVTILLTNHAMRRHPINAQLVRFRIEETAEPGVAYVERIDDDNSNQRRDWEEMGKPEYSSPRQDWSLPLR
jgi:hypothetical protein